MKYIITTILLALLTLKGIAQKDSTFMSVSATVQYDTIPTTWYKPLLQKKDWIVYTAQFLSGFSDGIREQVLYHPNQLFEQFPNLNRQWWDSRISWQNKYSISPLLVAFSDANHGFKGASLILNCVSIAFSLDEIPKKGKALFFIKKIVFSYLSNKAGFTASYYGVFKNNWQ